MQRLLFALSIGLAPFALAASVYQWKDANGNMVYSDQPPPGQAATQKSLQANVMQTSGGGYSLREAIRKSPVTLWMNNCGDNCDSARALLTKRGVPYSLRNPEASAADTEALKKLVGAVVAPVLQVGTASLKGFDEGAWQSALDQAGYPKAPDPTFKAKSDNGGKPGDAPKTPGAH